MPLQDLYEEPKLEDADDLSNLAGGGDGVEAGEDDEGPGIWIPEGIDSDLDEDEEDGADEDEEEGAGMGDEEEEEEEPAPRKPVVKSGGQKAAGKGRGPAKVNASKRLWVHRPRSSQLLTRVHSSLPEGQQSGKEGSSTKGRKASGGRGKEGRKGAAGGQGREAQRRAGAGSGKGHQEGPEVDARAVLHAATHRSIATKSNELRETGGTPGSS